MGYSKPYGHDGRYLTSHHDLGNYRSLSQKDLACMSIKTCMAEILALKAFNPGETSGKTDLVTLKATNDNIMRLGRLEVIGL
jgi:hypothetical protein